MAKSSTLSRDAVSELRRRHPQLHDPRYLEFFALKNQSLSAADLLAREASNDCCSSAEEYSQKFTECTTNFEAAASFARVFGLLGGDAGRATALDLFEMAIGRSRVKLSPSQFDYYIFLLVHFGHSEKAKRLSKKPYVQAATSYEIDPERWFENFKKLFGSVGNKLVALTPAQNSFRQLAANSQNLPVSGESLVSVVMTTYKPDADAEHAINSILAQTYTNFELIIVDDGSGPEYRKLLESFQAKDSRIRLVLLEKNVGTYGARNAGWLHANGRYLTGQDSDDWAHPMRLELQVKNLDAKPQLAGNWCRGIRVNEHLQLDIRDGNFPLRRGERSVAVSMMIRHSPTFLRLGFFDGARKGADTEYLHRLKAVFGVGAFSEIPEVLYVIQARYDSLSRTDFAPDWKHPNRQVYATAFGRWHRKLAAGKGGHFIDLSGERKFPVPFAFTPAAKRNVSRDFDLVFLGDWYSTSKRQTWLLSQLKQAVAEGKKVGFAHVDSFFKKFARQGKPMSELFELYESGAVDFVALDDKNVSVGELVTAIEFIYFAEQKTSTVDVKKVELVAFEDTLEDFRQLSAEVVEKIFPKSKIQLASAN